MPASFLKTHHDPVLVGASLGVAVFSSYVALGLARRLRAAKLQHRAAWWAGGSIAMGTGIWAMHFVGMLGFEAGIPLGYGWLPTLASWAAAVAAAGIALAFSARERLTRASLALGSAAMGAGISAMHYLGMHALALAPGIDWQPALVAASIAIAWGVSASALALFSGLRQRRGARGVRQQLAAAVVMGLAIGGMHYTGMAAARLPEGAVCLTRGALTGEPLGLMVAVATVLLLAGALGVSIIDALAEAREAQLARSLDAATASLQRRALEDALTGLPNRTLFNDRLEQAVARLADDGTRGGPPAARLAVLLVDVDGFHAINASFGQRAGDEVLLALGARLQAGTGPGTTVARLGGDEFALLVEAPDALAATLDQAQRILRAVGEPFRAGGRALPLSCSIGIALYPQHDDGGQRLLAQAEGALVAARRAGGGRFVLFESGMDGEGAEQMLLLHALRGAIEHGELMLHYQPTVHAADGSVHGLEALLRWRHPERGLVSPSVFVPLAERFGLIGRFGDWVLEAACAQLALWQAQGWRGRVAINLSPHQLLQPDLPRRILQCLARHGLEPSRLVCEITETAMMEHMPAQRALLDELAAAGVCISIDDFGTGYSSLAHLRHLPARQLKIDRSFVADLGTDPDALAVLEAVVRLAQALRMEVVAEGVETAAQRALLADLGCDVLQGYTIARPMPADAVLPWLAAWQGAAVPATLPAVPAPA